MCVTKKYKITIEQVKKETHHMTLDDTSVMGALDRALEMVKTRNQKYKPTGTVYSVKKVEEIKDE